MENRTVDCHPVQGHPVQGHPVEVIRRGACIPRRGSTPKGATPPTPPTSDETVGWIAGAPETGGVVVIRTIRSRGADGWAARSPQHMGVAGGEGQASAGIRRHPQAAEVCRGDGHGPRLRMGVEAPEWGQGGRGGGQEWEAGMPRMGGSGAQNGWQGDPRWEAR